METSSSVIPLVKDIQLTATLPHEMVTSQIQLLAWCDQKLSALHSEAAELKEAFEIAVDRKWNSSTLKGQHDRAKKRIVYYEKIKAALEAGYYIIPNFPVSMFAIRTKKQSVNPKHSSNYWGMSHEQDAQELPINEGQYKNPIPMVMRISEDRTSDGKVTRKSESYATDWQDEIDFPITMAKPVIMEATSQAMALKIFDQFGIMPADKNEDPVIIGQIKLKSGYRTKQVSFMIAWHLNTNIL